MPKLDPVTVAIYAAGIADALACMESDDMEKMARLEAIIERHGGHIAVMQAS